MDNELILNEKERKKEKRKLYRDIVFIILLGLLLIWFTGSYLANRNNNEINDNEIKTQLVSRSNKTIKSANRKTVDIINNRLSIYNSNLNYLELSYSICNNFLDTYDNIYYFYCSLRLDYNLNTNSFIYNEFEVEFSDESGDYYFLDYYTANGFNEYLTNITYGGNSIDVFTTRDEIGIVYTDYTITPTYDFFKYFTTSFGAFTDFDSIGASFSISNIIDEVSALKALINAKYNDGIIVGEIRGYDNGFDNGYDEGYDEGYQEGNSSGYQNGYSAGETVGYNNGYSEGETVGYNNGYSEGETVGYNKGYQVGYDEGLVSNEGYEQGYDEGYDIGHNRGYDQGLSVGLTQGYDNGFVDGQKDTVNEKGFKTLFNAIMNAPYNIFKGILNFEFLGVNLFSLFSFIFTTMLILWIVKIFKK